MNDKQTVDILTCIQMIATNLAQLVLIQQQRLTSENIHMTIDDSLMQQVVDAINAALLAESNDVAAMAAKDATIASLQAQLAPNPALLASVQQALANAIAANPPATPAPLPAPSPTPAPVGAP
jgi:hypothetical protein